jgi:hypothetical protein
MKIRLSAAKLPDQADAADASRRFAPGGAR